MAAERGFSLRFVTESQRLMWALLLMGFVSLGCVNLTPRKPDRPDAKTAGGGFTYNSVQRSSGGGLSKGTAGAGGSRGGPVDAGPRASSTITDTSSVQDGGYAGMDAALTAPDLSQSTGGLALDAAGGSQGSAGTSSADSRVGGSGGTTKSSSAGGKGGGGQTRDAASPTDTQRGLCTIGTSLIHRYSFDGTGTGVRDSVGTAHGTVVNAQLTGTGALVLAGGNLNQYVDLPNRLLSKLTSATFEFWVTWAGSSGWNQRILDFGSNEPLYDGYHAVTTVIISPNSAPDRTPRLRASCSSKVSEGSTFVDAPSPLAVGSIQHLVVVLDGERDTLSMYLNGELVGQTKKMPPLSQINDVNNWLGKSQYAEDVGFAGTYYEFRIYDAALTAGQIQIVHQAGQDASFDFGCKDI